MSSDISPEMEAVREEKTEIEIWADRQINEALTDGDFTELDNDVKTKIRNLIARSIEIIDRTDRYILKQMTINNIIPRSLEGVFYIILGKVSFRNNDVYNEIIEDILLETNIFINAGLDQQFEDEINDNEDLQRMANGMETKDLQRMVKGMIFYKTSAYTDVLKLYISGVSPEIMEKINNVNLENITDIYFSDDWPIIGISETAHIEQFENNIKNGRYKSLSEIPFTWIDFFKSNNMKTVTQQSSGNAFTNGMLNEQEIINQTKKVEEQNEFIRRQILKLNQNKTLSNKPLYPTQRDDIDMFNRRMSENNKFQKSYENRNYIIGEMSNIQQALTRQAYANLNWGIPPIAGNVNGSEEYFTGSY